MLYSIKSREDFEGLDELASIENQVKDLRLQDKLGKQTFHDKIKKAFESVTDTIRRTYEDSTKTMFTTSKESNKALENFNEKVLELLRDKGMIAFFLTSSVVNLFKPENKSQLKLIKDHNSIRKNIF